MGYLEFDKGKYTCKINDFVAEGFGAKVPILTKDENLAIKSWVAFFL